MTEDRRLMFRRPDKTESLAEELLLVSAALSSALKANVTWTTDTVLTEVEAVLAAHDVFVVGPMMVMPAWEGLLEILSATYLALRLGHGYSAGRARHAASEISGKRAEFVMQYKALCVAYEFTSLLFRHDGTFRGDAPVLSLVPKD